VAKLEAFGFIKSRTSKRKKVMTTPIHTPQAEHDPDEAAFLRVSKPVP